MNQRGPGGAGGPMVDHWTRPPKKPRSEFLAIILVLTVAIGIWLLNGRDPGMPSSVPVAPEISTSTSGQPGDDPDGNGPDIDPVSGLPRIDVTDLPVEATEVLGLIDRGGPFRYDQDGSRFGNFERILPDEPDGYYTEYTVDTPGAADRGARRIVAGDGGESYWTRDRYESFFRIVR